MKLPHLVPALIALLIAGAGLVGFNTYARQVESASIRSVAPLLFPLKNQGLALQKIAFRQPDLLLLYGSSELVNHRGYQTRYHPSEFFGEHPTGFRVFPVGRGGFGCLAFFQALAAVGSDVSRKKVAISLTPLWFFNRQMTDWASHAGNFSKLHAGQLVFSTDLSFDVKHDAARRMLDYPATLKKERLLQFAVGKLASDSLLDRVFYYGSLPLGKLQNLVLRLQDHWETLAYLREEAASSPVTAGRPTPIDWQGLAAQAEWAYWPHTRNNPLGVDDLYWVRQYGQLSKDIVPTSQQFLQGLEVAREWVDLELLLRGLKELGAQPLILSSPLHGAFFNQRQIPYAVRKAYYDKLHNVADPFGATVLDFADHDGDLYFTIDISTHLSPKGWIYYNEALDAFYHDRQPGSLKELASIKAAHFKPVKQEPASITANPNPVPAGPGVGKTTVSWHTSDSSVGYVYVSVNGKPETLFGQGAKHSQDAHWIRAGLIYEFRLYAGVNRAKLLNKVVVTRVKER